MFENGFLESLSPVITTNRNIFQNKYNTDPMPHNFTVLRDENTQERKNYERMAKTFDRSI